MFSIPSYCCCSCPCYCYCRENTFGHLTMNTTQNVTIASAKETTLKRTCVCPLMSCWHPWYSTNTLAYTAALRIATKHPEIVKITYVNPEMIVRQWRVLETGTWKVAKSPCKQAQRIKIPQTVILLGRHKRASNNNPKKYKLTTHNNSNMLLKCYRIVLCCLCVCFTELKIILVLSHFVSLISIFFSYNFSLYLFWYLPLTLSIACTTRILRFLDILLLLSISRGKC